VRILLAQNSLYFPAYGGGEKSNRLLMEALAARAHQVSVVSRVQRLGPAGHETLARELSERGVLFRTIADAVTFDLNGVDVRVLSLDSHWRAFFAAEVAEFDPDVILTSTDDPAQLLFELALKSSRARVVYLVRATIAVPFGPDSSFASAERTARLSHADAVVGVSQYVAGYCRRWGRLDAVHVPISLVEPGRPDVVGRFDNRYVMIVNPCAVKGIIIFLGLADRMPDVTFAAVPTWGTTARDLEELRKRSNIAILDPVDCIDDLLTQARVILAPSLWAEARSRIVVEAMVRGIPVIASDVGGIREAMMGVDYLLPVHQITGYHPTLDDHMVPLAEVPSQDIEPWVEALRRITSGSAHWDELSRRSRRAAIDYLDHLNVLPFEKLLETLLRQPKRVAPAVAASRHPLENLSEEKKKLLALRLKQRAAAERSAAGSRWFLGADAAAGDKIRLFCFPPAGGGALSYKSWQAQMRDVALLCPARLPGRENRLNEPPLECMHQLVAELTAEMELFLDRLFAFFGHSMGAVVGFELARELRRQGKRLPLALIASAARAPQFRLNHVPPPEPPETEFLDHLRRLEGVPPDVLANKEMLQLMLPALRADTRVYDRYAYTPAEPLPFPIFAYGGDADPNVTPAHLDAWRHQTTAAFARRQFPGGHFYIQTARDALLAALAQDLRHVS
jgi:surfactin synthase thioesterase subunit/glycosyltransferase involved in cell wall biosynthesis